MILSGNAHKQLSEDISKHLGIQLGKCQIGRYADGEVSIKIDESVRGRDIFIIQPTCSPVNENLVELLLLVGTLRRSSARKINLLIPYYGYSRQVRNIILTAQGQENRAKSTNQCCGLCKTA